MSSIMLSALIDPSEFSAAVKKGYITERAHDKDSFLRIYTYSRTVQFGGIWTDATLLARGLMLRFESIGDFSNAMVVGRGLPKFFTIEQIDSDWGRVKLVDDDENVTVSEAPVIPWTDEAIVSEKLNGALGLSYILQDGSFNISTKGSFGSLEANVANRVLDEKHDRAKLAVLFGENGDYSEYTALFEIITPERPHPVDYGDLEDVLLLGLMSKRDGYWIPAGKLDDTFGFTVAKTSDVTTLREAVELPYQDNTEGLVVTVNSDDGSQSFYKVKPNEYLQLRKLFYATRIGDLLKIMNNISDEDFSKIQKPEDINLSSRIGISSTGSSARMIAERERMIFDTLVSEVHNLIAEYRKIASDVKNDTIEMSNAERADYVKNHAADTSMIYSALYDLENGTTDKLEKRARAHVLKFAKKL